MRRWKRYPAYRDSGVEWLGQVPEGWEVKRLKFLAPFAYGDALAAGARTDGAVPVFGSNGQVGTHDAANTRGETVIVGRKGSFGSVKYSLHSAFVIDTAFYVDSRGTQAHPRWLYYALQTLGLDEESRDAAVPGLSREIAHNKWCCLPPEEEQRAIAAFLDRETGQIDALIAKKERLSALLEERRTARIADILCSGLDPTVIRKSSGFDEIGPVPAHWPVAPLARFWTVRDCKHVTPPYLADGIPLVSTTEVKAGRLQLGTCYRFISSEWYATMTEGGRRPRRGDIVYSRNASLGAAAYVDTDDSFAMGQDVVLITSRRPDQQYLAYVLNSSIGVSQVERMQMGSTFTRINVDDIRRIVVPCPPPDEQAAIACKVDAIDAAFRTLAGSQRATLALLREQRQALITAAVTGQIDVRGEVPEVA